jgi:hypothetical protein
MRDNFMRVEGPRPDFPEPECPLLIVGSGRGMWHDLALYCLFQKRSHVMLVNRAIVDFKGPEFLKVKHAVCLDENCVELYRQIRQRIRRVDDDIELTHACGGKCDVRWIFDLNSGDRPNDSGAFATAVGMALGYKKMILVGVPHDGCGHYYGPPHEDLSHLGLPFRNEHWENLMDDYRDRVRSMSGCSRRLFGYPTKEWLNDE